MQPDVRGVRRVLIDMRQANRKGIQPSFRAAEVFALDDKLAETYRQNGFAALLSAPRGEILAGASALATTRDAAARDVMERGDVALVVGREGGEATLKKLFAPK